ncbi:flagellar biosynthesis anti-sigma factor FlgM [Pleionea litopenaei]|uniref:Negative regulator of flagellin synthesis n=1 Tax=Pleionea litopenaei TaxID=3070815 RepID=A0AA51X6U0_9GAMM|nr:flagellar biosynthesis anti-sigma factor FlgM [Pleionea sp. HL-JVS1]WMS87637.1 flagellar biosynthesis anti-sigma factor FlgM [Pleionea sp. HL-JVS1]
MAIDIKQVSTGKLSGATTQNQKVKGRKISDDSESGSDTAIDSVELTGKASMIGAMIQQMMAQPAVDRSRVDPVKEKIDEGRYEIENERVASKMLDFEVGYSRVR